MGWGRSEGEVFYNRKVLSEWGGGTIGTSGRRRGGGEEGVE